MSYEEFCKKEGQLAPSLEITATKEKEDNTETKIEIKKSEDPFTQVVVSTRDNRTKDNRDNRTKDNKDNKTIG